MKVEEKIKNLQWLRDELIGRNKMFDTPYGKKPLVYLDYTASGRNVFFIENQLDHIKEFYANSHTEDDFTGKTMTQLLHEAERRIKECVNAGPDGRIIFTESGTTGGITRLQQILGVYVSPATKERYDIFLKSCLARRGVKHSACHDALLSYIDHHKPIVFVSPYEHHSNELMWRQTLCDVVEVSLDEDGLINLEELKKTVSNPLFAQRPKIGSFSAGSNVTGILSDTYQIARILHQHNCLACFDFAACGPYVEIDMNKDADSYFDAVFLSPHKFLGGPGSSGILIFNKNIYRDDLPPSIAAGGTVDFVSKHKQLFVDDIETREKPGTPGILQALRVALAFELKKKVGVDTIEEIENHYMSRFYDNLADQENLSFLGITDPRKKVGIIPFNINYPDSDKILHPKFATKLMNDLFGIQTRAGCSCAGPYGHVIMHIENELSEKYLKLIETEHLGGVKPGWVRLNLHYVLSEEEFIYTVEAVKFVASYGWKFLSQYEFDIYTGEWTNINHKNIKLPLDLDIDHALACPSLKKEKQQSFGDIYKQNLREAEELATQMPQHSLMAFKGKIEELAFFAAVNVKDSEYLKIKGII